MSFNLPQASTGTATITIQSIGVFNDPVTLAATNLPNGVQVSFTPNPVTPPVGGSTTSIATISATRSVSTGTYTFSLTGTAGSIAHKQDVTLKVSGCLIATATYGSELSPEVQFLRDFRDYQILNTFAGSNFMIAFNAWYYSFSPTVANYIATHEAVKTTMKFVLYPLIGVLHLSSASYATLSFEPEVAALMAGVVASSLVGLVYLALPVSGVLWLARRRLQRSTEKRIAKLLGALTLVLLAGFVVSEMLAIPLAMILVSAALVLTILTIGAVLPAFAIVEFARRRQ
jgi:peptide/nickel transport system substrate-binding protein